MLRRDFIKLSAAAALLPNAGRAQAPSPFPLRPSPNRRALVDTAGRPFFLQGDSPQAIYQQLTAAEVEVYLGKRRAQGFSVLLCDPSYSNNNDGWVRPNQDGVYPFLRTVTGRTYRGRSGSADFAAPDPRYWDNVRHVMDRAEAHGFLVLHYVCAWGYGGKTMWLDLINPANSVAVCKQYGLWLGARFRDCRNVVWIDGSDYDGDDAPRAPDGTSGIARARAIADGMREAGAMQMRTGDWNADSLSTDQRMFAPIMSLNGVYTYGYNTGCNATYLQARRAWQYAPAMPAFLKESGYEAEHIIPSTRAEIRKYQWWTLLSGATAGTIYGNYYIWPFQRGLWQQAMDMPGALDMQRLGTIMRSLDFAALVPSGLSGMRRLVISPNGMPEPPRADHVAAAATPDSTLLAAYVPPYEAGPQSLTLDAPTMRRARWLDPTTARAIDAPVASAYATPGANASGANDWVLVLQA